MAIPGKLLAGVPQRVSSAAAASLAAAATAAEEAVNGGSLKMANQVLLLGRCASSRRPSGGSNPLAIYTLQLHIHQS